MKLIFIGDVVGKNGCKALLKTLPSLKWEYGADFVVVNGENSSDGNGITPQSAAMIFEAGADVITTGNHCFSQKTMKDEFDRNDRVLRPANFGNDVCGHGVCVLDRGSYKIAVINLIGTLFMQACDNPFKCAERIFNDIKADISIVDFHAEATSEKRAMGFFLSGKATAVLGTHTHVQTADEQIINGTGYITDVGMSGAVDSIIGAEKNNIIEKFLTYYPLRWSFADGRCRIDGAFIEADEKSGKCLSIERFYRLSDF